MRNATDNRIPRLLAFVTIVGPGSIDPSTSARSDCAARQLEILSHDAFAHKQSMRTIADEMAEVLRA